MRPDDGRAIPTFIRQALAGEPLTVTGDGSQTRSVCYVDDTIRGILALAESDAPGPVNIGGPLELPVAELATTVLELTGLPGSIRYVARPVDDPRVRRPDITLARELLNWEPQVHLRDGLARTIAWFRSQLPHPHMETYRARRPVLQPDMSPSRA
jgi:dTDP-glucose 4,6-dehydratase